MDLFKIHGTVEVNGDDAKQELESVNSKAESVFSKIGKTAGTVGKAMAGAFAVGATAVTALVTKSIQSYADYEQLVGGVDTLFKDSSKKVQEYAKNAYETAGLSANEYMETVTSFSASLLQSLNGDTAKSAEVADMAIRDMSDNANKMGTDMSMIQNAYQGFAKQNYTMLDNLKLGYGGTKEEMERLLADAEKLSGQKYDISNLNDVYQAIHIIQDELGITGTTAKEASQTISGSINAMKGSWQNLLTAFISSDLSLDDEIANFVNSVGIVADNVLPKIGIALDGVVQLVEQLAPKIIQAIPSLVSTLLPAITEASTSLVKAIVSALPALITSITKFLPDIIDAFVNIFNAIVEALPSLIEAIVSALPTLLPKIIDGLITMIVTLCTMLPQIIQPIIEHLPQIIIAIVTALVNNLPILIEGLITLIMAIVTALPQIIQALVDALPTVISAIVSGILRCLPQLIQGLVELVLGLVEATQQIWGSFIEAVGAVFKGLWDGIKDVFKDIGKWFSEKFNEVKEKVVNKVNELKTKATNIFTNIKTAISDKVEAIKTGIVDKFNAVKEKVTDIFNKVKSAITKPIEKARDTVKGIIDKIKGFFNFDFKLPKIKLPKFSVQPSGWKIGDLLKGSIPKLGITWNKDGAIFSQPTIFDTRNGLQGAGEAGPEAIAPISKLQDYVRVAVENSNTALEERLDVLTNILLKYLPELQERQLVLDTGVLVGEMTTQMDRSLGDLTEKRARGR